MSEQRKSKEGVPGPAPLPTWHGTGCRCGQSPRDDCPAAQTPEGKALTRYRALNGARCRLREAEHRLQEAMKDRDAALSILLSIDP